MNVSKYLQTKSTVIKNLADYTQGKTIPDYPVAVMIEVSNVCNNKCLFCFHHSAINPDRYNVLRQVDRGFIDANSIQDSLESVLPHALTVYPFGGGEPTIHPQFSQIIEKIASYEVMIDFITNGMKLNEAMSSQMVKLGVHRITISFSGATKNEYESVYIGSNFDKVLANIKGLAKQKRLQKSRYPIISINSIGFEHHIEKLPKFIDLMGKAGVNEISVAPLLLNSSFPELYPHCAVYNPARHDKMLKISRATAAAYGITLSTDNFERLAANNEIEEKQIRSIRMGGTLKNRDIDSLKKIEITEIKKLARNIEPEADRTGPQVSPVNLSTARIKEAEDQLQISRMHPQEMPFYYCMEPFKTMYIKLNGMVEPCCLWPGGYSMGNARNQAAFDIWKGGGYESMRQAILRGGYPQNCKLCVQTKISPQTSGAEMIPEYISWYESRFGVHLDYKLQGNIPPQIVSAKLVANLPGESMDLNGSSFPAVYGGDEFARFKNKYGDKSILSKITGCIDNVSGKGMFGWLWAPEVPGIRLPVGLYLDGELVEKTMALIFREDLMKAGIGDGAYGYQFTQAIDINNRHHIAVRVPGTEFEQVYNQPFTINSISLKHSNGFLGLRRLSRLRHVPLPIVFRLGIKRLSRLLAFHSK
jgi:MoaA/NifB/PqqE/SkfB family radical SAM enzyme